MEGVHRFLARSYRLVTGGSVTETEPSNDQLRSLHIAIKRVCLSCLSWELVLYLACVDTPWAQSSEFLPYACCSVEGLPSDAMLLKCR